MIDNITRNVDKHFGLCPQDPTHESDSKTINGCCNYNFKNITYHDLCIALFKKVWGVYGKKADEGYAEEVDEICLDESLMGPVIMLGVDILSDGLVFMDAVGNIGLFLHDRDYYDLLARNFAMDTTFISMQVHGEREKFPIGSYDIAGVCNTGGGASALVTERIENSQMVEIADEWLLKACY